MIENIVNLISKSSSKNKKQGPKDVDAYQASANDVLGEILFINHARLIDSKGEISDGT